MQTLTAIVNPTDKTITVLGKTFKTLSDWDSWYVDKFRYQIKIMSWGTTLITPTGELVIV